MHPSGENLSVRLLRLCPGVLAVFVIATGCVVLAGWFGHIDTIKRIDANMATMKPNAAVAFLLAGTSLWLQSRRPPRAPRTRAAQILAGCAALIGLATLTEYGTGLNLGLDELLFRDDPGSVLGGSPGRMSLASACFF